MDNDRIRKLILKGLSLVPENIGYSQESVLAVESELAVVLASDMKVALSEFAYDGLPVFQFLGFGGRGNASVVSETLMLRERKNVPHCFLILLNDETGVVLLETKDSSNEDSPVHIVDLNDIEGFIHGETPQYEYQYFPSFTDFFEFLIEQEEQYQQESSGK